MVVRIVILCPFPVGVVVTVGNLKTARQVLRNPQIQSGEWRCQEPNAGTRPRQDTAFDIFAGMPQTSGVGGRQGFEAGVMVASAPVAGAIDDARSARPPWRIVEPPALASRAAL